MVDLASTELAGTTLNTWARLLEKEVRVMTTEAIMQPRTIFAGLTAFLFFSIFFLVLDMFFVVSSAGTNSLDSFFILSLTARVWFSVSFFCAGFVFCFWQIVPSCLFK